MKRRVLKVGGVDEPFNLPWIAAIESGAFNEPGVEVTYTNYAGGTGALVAALEKGELDLATVLTEGGVTAIARGSTIKLHSAFTESALRWGIHVAANATETTVSDLEGKRFAISRFGSGSELMAYVLADQEGWTLAPEQFVVVGGVDGAIEALPKGEADIFLWERFVTQPLVDQGIFRRVGELPTPWPAFYTAARPGLLEADRTLVDHIVEVALANAAELKADREGSIDRIVNQYGMAPADAHAWHDGVDWPSAVGTDRNVLTRVMDRMVELGRIESPVPLDCFL